jgi:hypothetical protein
MTATILTAVFILLAGVCKAVADTLANTTFNNLFLSGGTRVFGTEPFRGSMLTI